MAMKLPRTFDTAVAPAIRPMSRCRLDALALLSAFLVLLALPHAALSAPITIPTALSPGQQYRLVFVTSTTRDATSANIGDYNTFVTGAANAIAELAALGTTWTAIASTQSVDARDNTNTRPTAAGGSLGVPIFLLDGTTKVVDSYDDLWDGDLDAAIQVDETGSLRSAAVRTNVWTGSDHDGTEFPCPVCALGAGFPVFGDLDGAQVGWMHISFQPPAISERLYGMSDLLTVPFVNAPEPATLAILGFGLAGLGFMKRRRAA